MDAGTLVSARFRIVRCIGSGATGDVYEAVDRDRGGRTAIKALRLQHPLAINRFKHEFRVLQDLEHPNLVSLGELIEENGRLFFTMELVDGNHFLNYVRPNGTGFDETRLRHAFAELGTALEALHARGVVHRDLKPSNVLATDDDRIVLLDFGLALDLEDQGPAWSGPNIVGTPHYMSPEQAAGQPAGPASDWYSAGVMLYEALTGGPPHEGSVMKILTDKQSVEPTPPAALDPAIPADLSGLCSALLRFHPAQRPTSATGIRQVRREPRRRSSKRITGTPTQGPLFVGRQAELMQLRAILDSDVVRDGAPAVVLIRGESGVGKTTLARAFLRSIENDALVVRGRCFERESVPYKAFDGVVDGLTRVLGRMEPAVAAAMLPLHAAALADVFPDLKRVKAFADAPTSNAAAHRDLRDHVFGALRELLVRLGRRHTLALAIDDLQWADEDSLALLEEIVRQPDAPPLMLLATLRPRNAPGVADIEARIRAACPQIRTIELGPLEPAASQELAERLCALHDVRDRLDAKQLADEAAGHPLFLDELVRHAASGGTGGGLRLDDALWERAAALDPKARVVLEVVSLAGEPLHHDTIVRAADLAPEQLVRVLSLLRVANLVRTTGAGADDSVEPYHDRVRAAIVGHLDADRRRELHHALAIALEASQRRGHEPMLAFHWQEAGRSDLAAGHAAAAAAAAVDTLAFERAVRFYRLALELGHPDRGELLTRLGEALGLDGRGPEAADAYLAAADTTTAVEVAIERRRLAAEQLLISGHIDRGIELISTVLATLGMGLPATPQRALASLVLRRGLLRARGLRFRERQEGSVAASELTRVDLCWSVAGGLAMVDTIRGADFQTRHLLLALRAGEPTRVARALATEGGFHSVGGVRSRRRAAKLFAEARALLARHPSEYVASMLTGSECIHAYQAGEWRRALELARKAELEIRNQKATATWEHDTVDFFTLYSLFYLGEVRELAILAPALLRLATGRGDLFGATNLRVGLVNAAWLVPGDVEAAREHLADATRQWTARWFHLQHYHHMFGEAHVALYAGEAEAGRRALLARWPALKASQILRISLIREEDRHLRARMAIAAAFEGAPDRDALLREAAANAKDVSRVSEPAVAPLGELALAAVDHMRGDDERAVTRLRACVTAFERAEMGTYAAAARAALGRTLGGDEGAALVRAAEDAMHAQSVADPARWFAMLAPGF
ncbi:MAG TPA: AAA family ATPase [Kofleriaceae bacterium]|nr:AAA family ATPase [Kofleriaceae bacterium]